jgi:hypothetical protein
MIRGKPGQGAWPLRLAKNAGGRWEKAVAPAYFAGTATDKFKRPRLQEVASGSSWRSPAPFSERG